MAWDGVTDLKSGVVTTYVHVKSIQGAKKDGSYLFDLIDFIGFSKDEIFYWLLKLITSFGISSGVTIALSRHFDGTTRIRSRVDILARLLQQSGITDIFECYPQWKIGDQPYAADIREAVTESKTIKLLMLAGYEYFGRGHESLLYDIVQKKNNVKLDFILLDIDNAEEVVNQRVEHLRNRDETYTSDQLKQNVRATRELLRSISSPRKKVEIRLTKMQPVFRLLILDDCLFMSTYAKGVHGHESPVFKVEKAPKNGTSIYDAYLEYFEQVKCLAAPAC